MKPIRAFKRPSLFFRIFLVVLLTFINLTSIDLPKANAAVPGAPTITGVTRGESQLSIAFTAPAAVTPAITNYEYSLDGGTNWVTRSPASTASPLVISGLTNCQVYTIKIRAVNSDGVGAASSEWKGVPGTLTYHLNNGQMKFGAADTSGNGEVASILNNGNLKQPWYKNSSGVWKKMTFSDYALNFALAVGGTGTNEWNTSGTLVEFSSVTLSQMTIDCSQFVTTSTSGTLATGYGTLSVSGRYTFSSGETVEITRSYTQSATSKYTTFRETIKNVGATTMSNARLWVGTQDDWIGDNDSNSKSRGNIVDGVFTQIPTAATQAKVLKIFNGTDTVYFYTTSNLGYTTGLKGYGNFQTQVMNQDPSTAAISVTNDGSYGMYLRFQDITSGSSETFTWYYIASSAAQADALLGTVASAALPTAPTIDSITAGPSQLSVNFTAGDPGGSAITNYQYQLDGGNWQTMSPADNTSPLVISGLENSRTYSVKIRAINSEGYGSASNAVSGAPLGPPQAPTITGITQTDTTASVSFTAPSSDGGASITNYRYSINNGQSWTTLSPASTSSPIAISGLSPGTSYNIKIQAVNSYGNGTESATSAITTFDVPEAPTISAITPGNGSLSVAFTSGGTGGTQITNYQYSIDSGLTWITRSPSSTFSPLLITGLTNGTTYDVLIRAVNSVGSGEPSNLVAAAPYTVPAAVVVPSNTNVTPTDRTITVTFTAPSNGGSPITRYEYSTDRGGSWKQRTDGGGLSTTNFTITSLSSNSNQLVNGTEYCIQIRAVNIAGSGQGSEDVCTTPKTVPDAPTISSTQSQDRAIQVSYQLGSNGGAAITDIEYSLDGGSTWTSSSSITSPLRISGLTNGTQYSVTIRAKNSVGYSSAPNSSSVTPATNPSSPSITSLVTSAGSVSINFSAPQSNGGLSITNYQYQLDGGSWQAFSPVTTTSPVSITGLTNGQTYAFAIRAITSSTFGDSSSVVYGTPSTTPSAPISPSYAALNGRITVTWTGINDGGSPVTTYEYCLTTCGTLSNWVSANVTSSPFTISGLTNGSSYTVQFRAKNSNGAGAIASSSTLIPKAVPESPVITATSNSTDRQISVSFSEPANNGSTITNYQYSTDNGLTWINRTDGPSRLSPMLITKLSSDGTTSLVGSESYTIKIRAVNANGSGAESSSVTVLVNDNTAPTVSSFSPSGGTDSASRSLTFNLVLSESIQGLTIADFEQSAGTATCSISSVSASTGTTFTISVSCSTDGTYQLRFKANSVSDSINNGPTSASTASTVTIDTAVPTATLTSPSASSSTRTLTYSVTFSSSVTGISTADLIKSSGTASCSTSSVSTSSGTTASFTVTCSTDGTIVMQLSADSVSRGSATGPVNPVTGSLVTIDSSTPAVISFAQSSGTDVATRSLTYDLVFSESIQGLVTSDFEKASGTATCTISSVSASSGTTFTVAVTCTTDGTYQLRLKANSVTDGTNNGPASASSALLVTIDTSVPTASVSSPGATSSSRVLTYIVTFSANVTGISTSDFSQSSGSASCTTTAVSTTSGSSATFTVTCSSDGTVVMAFAADAVSRNGIVGPASAVSSTSVKIDTVAPTVSSLSNGTGNGSSSRILIYDLVFSEAVQGLTTSDFEQAGGTASCTVTSVSASTGTTFTVTVSCTSDGTYQLRLKANSVSDGTNNGPGNVSEANSVTVDSVVPTASISVASINTDRTIVDYEVIFSENVAGIAASDFIKSGGTATCNTVSVNASTGTNFTFTVRCTVGGTIEMKLLANSASDGANSAPAQEVVSGTVSVNGSTTANQVNTDTSLNSTQITASISSSSSASRVRNLTYTVNFSERVSGISSRDFAQSSGSARCTPLRVSQSSGISIVLTVICSTDGTVTIQMLANSVSNGTINGPSTVTLSPEVVINTNVPLQPTVTPRPTTTPTPLPTNSTPSQPTNSPTPIVSPLPSDVTRGPIFINGELPEILTPTPVTVVSGVQVQTQVDQLPTGGKEVELPSGASVVIDAKRAVSTPANQASNSGLLKVTAGDSLVIQANGMKPGTKVEIWLFSTPRLLGVVQVNADGTVSAEVPLSADIPSGQHTAQVSGVDTQGSIISVNAGVEIVAFAQQESKINYLIVVAIALVVSTGFALYGFRFVRRKKSDS